MVSIRLEDCPVSADGLQDNSSARTPRKTVPPLLSLFTEQLHSNGHGADHTENQLRNS
jgi:hypothetical protein